MFQDIYTTLYFKALIDASLRNNTTILQAVLAVLVDNCLKANIDFKLDREGGKFVSEARGLGVGRGNAVG